MDERERDRLYRMERRAEQTEQERGAERENVRLYQVEHRAERTEEERQAEQERERLYQVDRRAERTEEEAEAEREHDRIYRVEHRAEQTEDERETGQEHDRLYRMERRAERTEEECEAEHERNRLYHAERRAERTEEEQEAERERVRIRRAMGHYLGSMLPYVDRRTGEESAPKFAQIYIVDPDMRRRTERRQGIFSSLDPVHLMDLEDLMARYNPFAQQFLTFGERLREDIASGKEVVDIVYKLHADHRHPGTHNLPAASEVAATMVEDGNLDKHRDLLLYARDRGLLRLFETSPMYDPLQYPLLFPLGDLGWTFTDTYADGNQRHNNTKMSLREHVAFRLFQKTSDGSVLHLGGRLFQQWTVDQQAKAEQERLRWVAGHQKDIRADQYKGFEDALLNESTAGKTHSITKLIVHLDGYQMVLFRADDNPEEVLQRESHTTLTRYFELCASEAPENQVAKRLYYQEIPKLFR
ncbi:hypothetical protein BBJ28_00023180 [Nothophytophthora sp. Chile5]|nr:hypothetical protein BBJ28_00024302 [Nothophytophthora sp. Chile5]RLN91278.1 hypothetical protein BBJ28_00023180 [Nothophytophthora sp. Chile5]